MASNLYVGGIRCSRHCVSHTGITTSVKRIACTGLLESDHAALHRAAAGLVLLTAATAPAAPAATTTSRERIIPPATSAAALASCRFPVNIPRARRICVTSKNRASKPISASSVLARLLLRFPSFTGHLYFPEILLWATMYRPRGSSRIRDETPFPYPQVGGITQMSELGGSRLPRDDRHREHR